VIIVARDLHLARLQVGFVESRRSEIIRLLARARWNVVSRLRHGRITHVLGEDIQATGGAAQLLLQCVILCALLVVQFALLILLSPTLAALGVALGVVGLVTLRPALNRSRELGTRYTATQLELTNSTHQFLGGLKLAMSQNLEQTYVRAFEDTLDDAARQQIAFARQRVLTQIIWSSAVAGAAGLSILIGIGIMATAPALLVAFLFILARMSGEAIRVQASLQQIFHSLPAYGKLKALTQELQAAGSGEGQAGDGESLAGRAHDRVSRRRLPPRAGGHRCGRAGRRRRSHLPDRGGRVPRRDGALGRGEDHLNRPSGGTLHAAGGRDCGRRRAAVGDDALAVAREHQLHLAGQFSLPRQHPQQSAVGATRCWRTGAVGSARDRRGRGDRAEHGARPGHFGG
jgi:ABC-type multidrug transport system fused ATPase/permease subunit